MSDQALLVVILIAVVATLVTVLVLLGRVRSFDERRIQSTLQEELRVARQETATTARDQRTELQAGLKTVNDSLLAGIRELREAYTAAAGQNRETLATFSTAQDERFRRTEEALIALTRITTEATDKLRETLATSVKTLQEGNERKLEEMRITVDEKLQGTLEKRLGESFALVSERLEAVQRGLGEMQVLATGVGDLKKVLTNVKTRGTFGEVQLRAILEQILSPEQYRENFAPRAETGERVEFAIVLPGRDHGEPVYLPVDSKFPQEDFVRLVDATERGDSDAMAMARASLTRGLKGYARDVCEKYICPPTTTDFALIFLPTEGLYAEALRQPDLVEELQRTYSIVIAGPTTFAALLNSLRMGFRTLAIEKRSSEVWQVLGAVKTEFAIFGQVIDKVKKQLHTAAKTLDDTTARTRAMERRLRTVEETPADLAASVIGYSERPLLDPATVELDEAEVPDESGEEDFAID